GVFQLHEKFAVTAGLDIGSQQDAKDISIFYNWYTPVLILKYSPLSKLNIAGRVEWYDDRHQQVIATNSKNGFQTYGYSLNLDYSLNEHIVFRIEGRGLKSKDAIFTMNQRPSKENYFFTAAMAISF
ncbi:MAG: outer membrane beta-barrel protein, partial [Sphingobacteriaceae bacterium]